MFSTVAENFSKELVLVDMLYQPVDTVKSENYASQNQGENCGCASFSNPVLLFGYWMEQ